MRRIPICFLSLLLTAGTMWAVCREAAAPASTKPQYEADPRGYVIEPEDDFQLGQSSLEDLLPALSPAAPVERTSYTAQQRLCRYQGPDDHRGTLCNRGCSHEPRSHLRAGAYRRRADAEHRRCHSADQRPLYQRDFRAEGRCAKNLGIEGMSKAQVTHFFETGEC